jgi:hypothetical protein
MPASVSCSRSQTIWKSCRHLSRASLPTAAGRLECLRSAAGPEPLVTLRDAALFITKLAKAEHEAEEWQAEAQALMLVAEHDGPTMFARIADSYTALMGRHQFLTKCVVKRRREIERGSFLQMSSIAGPTHLVGGVFEVYSISGAASCNHNCRSVSDWRLHRGDSIIASHHLLL